MAPSVIRTSIALGLSLMLGISNVQAQYPDPNDDPFYAVPGDVGDHSPGDVLNSRGVDTPQETLFIAESDQLLYRTTDQLGGATATVATLWVPSSPFSPPKILVYGYAEDALNIDCGPSWSFVNNSGSQANGVEKNVQAPLLVPWAASRGYYVVAADAEGPNSAWLVGGLEGNAVLDAVTAAINFKGLGSADVALYGYSGGAHTAVWAASNYAASPRSSFNIVGAAFGGTPVDLGDAYNQLDNSGMSSLAAAAVFGLGNGYPDLNSTLDGLLTDSGRQVASTLRATNTCPGSAAYSNVPQNVESLFTSGPRGTEPLETILKQESLLSNVNPNPVPVPTFPRLQYHGNNDVTVPYQPESDYVSQQCSANQGAQIFFSTFYGFDHSGAAIAGFVGALKFVDQALQGTPEIPSYCGDTGVSMPVPGSSDAIAVLGQTISCQLCQICHNLGVNIPGSCCVTGTC